MLTRFLLKPFYPRLLWINFLLNQTIFLHLQSTTCPVLPLLPSPPLYISGQPTSCICAKKQDLSISKKENMMEKLDRTMCRLAEEMVKIQQAKLNLTGNILQWIVENPNINHPVRCMIILNKRRSCKKRLFWESWLKQVYLRSFMF